MRIFHQLFFYSQKKVFFSKHFVFHENNEKKDIPVEEGQLSLGETIKNQEAVTSEIEGKLQLLNKQVVESKTTEELQSLKEKIQKEDVQSNAHETKESLLSPKTEGSLIEEKPATGIAEIDAYVSSLNEGGVDALKEQITPKTSFVEMIVLFLQIYFKHKNQEDVTGRQETWSDVEKLAGGIFKEVPNGQTSGQLLRKMLIEHKCNTPNELEAALSGNKNLEFDVVWSTLTNQFIVQHNFVSDNQSSVFTCKDAYGLMGTNGRTWSGDKFVLDLKGRLGMNIGIESLDFKKQSYQKIQSLLFGMPDNFKSKLYISTFDPYTEAMVWAYKEISEDSYAKNIKVMGDSMSIMSYDISDSDAKKALSVIQGPQSKGLVSAFQGFFGSTGNEKNHALHALSDRDNNGRADTKIHMSYADCARNGDSEANNIIATKDPIKVRAEQVGGSIKMRERIEAGLVISINDDVKYLKHIISQAGSNGDYYGVRPEDIIVYGVDNANELHDILFIAHQKGRKWAAVVHDVPDVT